MDKIIAYQNAADMTRIYQVFMPGCGHTENRRMRPSTAGVTWAADVLICASEGAECAACRSGRSTTTG